MLPPLKKPSWRHVLRVSTYVLLLAVTAGATAAAENPAEFEDLKAKLDELAPRAAYLRDRQEIWDASKRYTRGADRHDKELARSAFWPEATIGHGQSVGRDEFIDREEARLAGYAAHQHHITGQNVEIDGDTAHVESYLIYFLVPRDKSVDEPGTSSPGKPLMSEKTYLGSGRYIERWEQRDGTWKILVREYVEDLALEGETVDYCGSRTCLGTWDRTDLSYVRPLRHVTPEQRQAIGESNVRQTNPGNGDDDRPRTDGGSR